MKSKDQQLLEEAYKTINKPSTPSGISPEAEEHYWNAFEKVKSGEITLQQWYEICAKLLEDIMSANKDVFERLKNR
jgi:hypothetical protein